MLTLPKGKHGFGTCFVKDLGFTLKSPCCSFFIFGKRVNSLDFLVLFVVVQIVVTVSGRGMHPTCHDCTFRTRGSPRPLLPGGTVNPEP